MLLSFVIYLMSIIISSAAIGIYVDRRLYRSAKREQKQLPAPQIDRLLTEGKISAEDEQWLCVFRETIDATGERPSEFLTQWLRPDVSLRASARAQEIIQQTKERSLADANQQADHIARVARESAQQIINEANAQSMAICDMANRNANAIASRAKSMLARATDMTNTMNVEVERAIRNLGSRQISKTPTDEIEMARANLFASIERNKI